MRIELSRDPAGYPKARVDPPHEALGFFLEQDLQSNLEACHEIIATVLLLASGQPDGEWEETGNAFHLVLTRQTATIGGLSDEALVTDLSLEESGRAVDEWARFVDPR